MKTPWNAVLKGYRVHQKLSIWERDKKYLMIDVSEKKNIKVTTKRNIEHIEQF